MAAKSKAEEPPPLEHVLKKLAARRTELDKLDDKLSALIRRIETVLRTHVATRISRPIGEDDDGRIEFLSFGKDEGKFQLLVETGYQNRDNTIEIGNSTPLLSCSREKRTFVFADGHVEALIRSAHEQFEAQIAIRERALRVAEEIAAALEPIDIDSNPNPAEGAEGADDDLPF